MKTVYRKKAVSVIAVFALAVCTVLCGADKLSAEAKEPEKHDAVSVKTDASGTPYRVTVESTLNITNLKGEVRDVSNLKDIRNKNGDEEYRVDGRGQMVWDNHGADILYEGDADAESLPVAVRVTYYLNGRQTAPEKMAGASGRVKIRFDYENKTRGEAFVPFVFLTAALLDGDVFSNVEITNGQTTRMGEYLIATGIALPGLRDALKLASYEKTEDIEPAEYLEIEADAEDFALEFTATMVMNGLFEEADLSGLDDIDELLDGMDKVTEATEELTDGMYKLLDGAGTFRDGLTEYTDAADKIADGAVELADGMQLLKENGVALAEGANALAKGTRKLEDGLSQFDLSALTGGNGMREQEISDAAAALTANSAALGAALKTMQERMSAVDIEAVAKTVSDAGVEIASLNEQMQKTERLSASLGAQIDALNTEIAAQQAAAGGLNTVSGMNAYTGAEEMLTRLTGIRDALAAVKAEADAERAAMMQTLANLGNTLSAMSALSALSGIDAKPVADAAAGLQGALETLAPYMRQMSDSKESLEELVYGMAQLHIGVSQLSDGAAKLAQGVSAYTSGAWKAADGARELADGAKEFSDAGDRLRDGCGKLYDGISKAADGAVTFRDETKEALKDMDYGTLQEIFDALKTVQEADRSYTTFSGASEEYRSSVRFLFETDAVKR